MVNINEANDNNWVYFVGLKMSDRRLWCVPYKLKSCLLFSWLLIDRAALFTGDCLFLSSSIYQMIISHILYNAEYRDFRVRCFEL